MEHLKLAKREPRKKTSVSIFETSLEAAHELNINTSDAAQAGIDAAIKRERERQWIEESREAIEAFNDFHAEHGLPLQAHWAKAVK